MKKIISTSLAIVLLMNSVTIATPQVEKTETVYVNVDYYGTVSEINVTNDANMFGNTSLKDYGIYDSITYYTDTEYDKSTNTFESKSGDRIAYSGKVSNDLKTNIPWDIKIRYKLNGVDVVPKKLVNANGLVEMEVEVTPNTLSNSYYRNNYMLEITSTFDMNKFLSVDSEEAMVIDTGKTKTLMFVILPGQSKTVTIKMGSEKFEMDGLTFAMLPLTGDLLDKVKDIVDDKKDFEDAMKSLNKSADVVLYAMNGMTDSIEKMEDGLNTLKQGTNSLHDNAEERNKNITKLKDDIKDLSDLVENSKSDITLIKGQINDLTDLITDLDNHLQVIIRDTDKIEKDLKDLDEVVEKLPSDLEEIQRLVKISASLTSDLKSLLVSQSDANSFDTSEIETKMANLSQQIAALYAEAMTVEDVETKTSLLTTVGALKTELESLGATLNEIKNISDNATSTSSSLTKNLSSLSKRLGFVDSRLNKMIDDDSEVILDVYDDGETLIKDLNKTLKTVKKYSEKFVDDKDIMPNALDNLSEVLTKAQEFSTSVNDTITSLEKTLNVLDTKMYEATIEISDSLIDASSDLKKITNESMNVLNAKNKAKDVVKNRWDEIDEKTTIFNIDPDAKVVSFTSSQNDSPTKVQILIKTPEINDKVIEVEDLEPEEVPTTILEKIVDVFTKIFNKIMNLFK